MTKKQIIDRLKNIIKHGTKEPVDALIACWEVEALITDVDRNERVKSRKRKAVKK